MPATPASDPEAVISSTACSLVILLIPVKALFMTQTNGITPSTERSNAESGIGGVAEPGKTSESARSGTLLTLLPGVSAVLTGVRFLTASIPEAEPEELKRTLTGVLPREGTAAATGPLYVIS